MYPNPSGRKRIACSAFYEVVQNRYTPSSANFKESLTAGLPLKKPETLSNCVEPLLCRWLSRAAESCGEVSHECPAAIADDEQPYHLQSRQLRDCHAHLFSRGRT